MQDIRPGDKKDRTYFERPGNIVSNLKHTPATRGQCTKKELKYRP